MNPTTKFIVLIFILILFINEAMTGKTLINFFSTVSDVVLLDKSKENLSSQTDTLADRYGMKAAYSEKDNRTDLVEYYRNMIEMLYAYRDILLKIYPEIRAKYVQHMELWQKAKKDNDTAVELKQFYSKNPNNLYDNKIREIQQKFENYAEANDLKEKIEKLLKVIIDDFDFIKYAKSNNYNIAKMKSLIISRNKKIDYKKQFEQLYATENQKWREKASLKIKKCTDAIANKTLILLGTPSKPIDGISIDKPPQFHHYQNLVDMQPSKGGGRSSDRGDKYGSLMSGGSSGGIGQSSGKIPAGYVQSSYDGSGNGGGVNTSYIPNHIQNQSRLAPQAAMKVPVSDNNNPRTVPQAIKNLTPGTFDPLHTYNLRPVAKHNANNLPPSRPAPPIPQNKVVTSRQMPLNPVKPKQQLKGIEGSQNNPKLIPIPVPIIFTQNPENKNGENAKPISSPGSSKGVKMKEPIQGTNKSGGNPSLSQQIVENKGQQTLVNPAEKHEGRNGKSMMSGLNEKGGGSGKSMTSELNEKEGGRSGKSMTSGLNEKEGGRSGKSMTSELNKKGGGGTGKSLTSELNENGGEGNGKSMISGLIEKHKGNSVTYNNHPVSSLSKIMEEIGGNEREAKSDGEKSMKEILDEIAYEKNDQIGSSSNIGKKSLTSTLTGAQSGDFDGKTTGKSLTATLISTQGKKLSLTQTVDGKKSLTQTLNSNATLQGNDSISLGASLALKNEQHPNPSIMQTLKQSSDDGSFSLPVLNQTDTSPDTSFGLFNYPEPPKNTFITTGKKSLTQSLTQQTGNSSLTQQLGNPSLTEQSGKKSFTQSLSNQSGSQSSEIRFIDPEFPSINRKPTFNQSNKTMSSGKKTSLSKQYSFTDAQHQQPSGSREFSFSQILDSESTGRGTSLSQLIDTKQPSLTQSYTATNSKEPSFSQNYDNLSVNGGTSLTQQLTMTGVKPSLTLQNTMISSSGPSVTAREPTFNQSNRGSSLTQQLSITDQQPSLTQQHSVTNTKPSLTQQLTITSAQSESSLSRMHNNGESADKNNTENETFYSMVETFEDSENNHKKSA